MSIDASNVTMGEQSDGSYLTPYEITVVYDPTDSIQIIAAKLVARAQMCPRGMTPQYKTPAVCFLTDGDITEDTNNHQYVVLYEDVRLNGGFCARMLADVCGYALVGGFPTCAPVDEDAPASLRAYAQVHGAEQIADEIINARGTDSEKTSEYIARGRGILEWLNVMKR